MANLVGPKFRQQLKNLQRRSIPLIVQPQHLGGRWWKQHLPSMCIAVVVPPLEERACRFRNVRENLSPSGHLTASRLVEPSKSSTTSFEAFVRLFSAESWHDENKWSATKSTSFFGWRSDTSFTGHVGGFRLLRGSTSWPEPTSGKIQSTLL
jgi:hypothetical protein